MAIIVVSIGLLVLIFSAIVNVINLDININQKVIDLGSICFECGGKSLFFFTLFYVGIIPHMMKDNKKEKKSSTVVVLVLYALCMVGPMLKVISEIFTLI